jgi:hypothetical protein
MSFLCDLREASLDVRAAALAIGHTIKVINDSHATTWTCVTEGCAAKFQWSSATGLQSIIAHANTGRTHCQDVICGL